VKLRAYASEELEAAASASVDRGSRSARTSLAAMSKAMSLNRCPSTIDSSRFTGTIKREDVMSLTRRGESAMPAASRIAPLVTVILCGFVSAAFAQEKNLLADPSFEQPGDRDQFGHVFPKWGGWKYEGDCEFRVGHAAHTGKTSCLLYGAASPKIRIAQDVEVEAGRYKVTAWLRGLDLGSGAGNLATEFMFDGKYIPLKKNGTFGWTQLTYVADVKEKKKAPVSFGTWVPGYFWIDDVSLVKVGNDVAVTPEPVLGKDEAPINAPARLGANAVRCSECGYKNAPAQQTCYACGSTLESAKAVATGPAKKVIASFETASPFEGGTVVAEHASEGHKALRIDKSYVVLARPQDWAGYDFLKADIYTAAKAPIPLGVEIRDVGTRGYWDRVNYSTVIPPGQSTLILPIKQLYMGEKSRPGRMLNFGAVTKLVFAIDEKPPAPIFLDNVRLERDDSTGQVVFDGLYAFDFGTGTSPVMDGFTPITQGTLYTKGRGYGLKDARVWRSFDVLQPDPLYQDFLCIESGGLVVDVPNGKYRVMVNVDNPSGFWGEYQVFQKRTILAQGKPVVSETMDFESFRKKYFRFWNVESLRTDNTFDKYQKPYYHEKAFDVDVTNGQLQIGFEGENFACSVSAVVIFPVTKAAQGEKFLKFVEAKRRFYFDNYFKGVLHQATGDALHPSAEDRSRGYVVFQRDFMNEIHDNDTPVVSEVGKPLHGEGFAGEYEPVTVALVPLKDLGKVTVTASALSGPGGTIPASAIDVGYVSYRLSRVTGDGTVYTIKPRFVMPTNVVEIPKDVTRRFWLTVKTPANAKPGAYRGSVAIRAEKGGTAEIPVEFRVRAGALDPVDIPAGPFSYTINIPWSTDDPKTVEYNRQTTLNSLRKMREYGFTTCSGFPHISYRGFKNRKPALDFTAADAEMKLAKDLGFLAIDTYGAGVSGFQAYNIDASAMADAGFQDYSQFIRAVYSEVQKHADAQGWLPVYYNIGDEPLGDDLIRSAENAEAYRKAFPKGPPLFTAASSFTGTDRTDPHLRLAKALHVVSWNEHDEEGVKLLHELGSGWAFYNGGDRWTFGDYMYKATKQFGMKFRINWHWNASAGDPYYPLDCREDDYSWCAGTPDGQLLPTVYFEQLREGLDDYRRLVTLARLIKEKPNSPAAQAGRQLLDQRMDSFKLNQRDHDALFSPSDWIDFRRKVDNAIEAMRK
jgi:hypothetical protein